MQVDVSLIVAAIFSAFAGVFIVREYYAKQSARLIKRATDNNDLIVRWLQIRISSLETIISDLVRSGGMGHQAVAILERREDPSIRLYREMSTHFTLAELESLAFQVGINWENIGGSTLDTKTIALIQTMAELGRLDSLRAVVKTQRPALMQELLGSNP